MDYVYRLLLQITLNGGCAHYVWQSMLSDISGRIRGRISGNNFESIGHFNQRNVLWFEVTRLTFKYLLRFENEIV